MADEDVFQELLLLEHRGWQSLCDGTADRFWWQIMTDDALVVLADGTIMDRVALADELAHTPRWVNYRIDDARLVFVAAKAAALVYVGMGLQAGHTKPFVGSVSSVYGRRRDGWKLVLSEQNAVA